MEASDILDLFSGNPAQAQTSASALAQAIRQRRAAATLGAITGDSAMGAVGKEIGGQADKLETGLLGAAQHRAAQAIQRDQMANALAQHQAELAMQNRHATESERHNRVSERNAAMMAGAGMNLSPEAQAMAAQQYALTGTLPALGSRAVAPRIAIMEQAAKAYPGANIAANKATLHGDQASFQKLQTQADAVNAFERTALANLDQFLGTAKGIVDTGSPLFNLPARKFAEKVAGDPKLTQFNVARQVAVQEIGKVLSGAMGNAAVSDSARHEVETLLSPDASLAQIDAAATILKRDMANRKAAMASELGDVQKRMGGRLGPQPAAEPAPAAALSPQDQAAKEWAAANPNDPRAAKIIERLKAKGL